MIKIKKNNFYTEKEIEETLDENKNQISDKEKKTINLIKEQFPIYKMELYNYSKGLIYFTTVTKR